MDSFKFDKEKTYRWVPEDKVQNAIEKFGYKEVSPRLTRDWNMFKSVLTDESSPGPDVMVLMEKVRKEQK